MVVFAKDELCYTLYLLWFDDISFLYTCSFDNISHTGYKVHVTGDGGGDYGELCPVVTF